MTVTVGADPELFVARTGTNEIVPCVGILNGTKKNPEPLKGAGSGFYVQEDNVMCEFNVPPAESYESFRRNIYVAKNNIYRLLKPHGLAPRWEKVSHEFKATQLQSKQAKEFGCEPDYDAYAGGQIRNVCDATITRMRSCGGHIHLGGNFKCPDFVVALFMDLYFLLDGLVRFSPERSEWYGQPGIYRPKPYGIEYRTPDNSWVNSGHVSACVGCSALNVGKYLESSSAAEIKKAYKIIPWKDVRDLTIEKLTIPNLTAKQITDQRRKMAYLRKITRRLGVSK